MSRFVLAGLGLLAGLLVVLLLAALTTAISPHPQIANYISHNPASPGRRAPVGSDAPLDTPTDTTTPKPTSTPPPSDTPTGTVPPTSTETPTATLSPTSTQTPTPTVTRTPTSTPTPGAQLAGHVTWQGRPAPPDPLNRLPITLTLRLGTLNVNYPNLQTDAHGVFTVPIGIAYTGVYTWWVKGPQFLAGSGVGLLAGGPTVTQEDMGLQRSGDANSDNLSDIVDFTLLRAGFGRGCGDPLYDPRADFNGDCVVDIVDFTLLRGAFGQAGPNQPVVSCAVFPPDNIWNRNIAAVPTHTLSDIYIARWALSNTVPLHPDFGSCCWQGDTIGIPSGVVSEQPGVPIQFTQWGSQSDPGPYPVPTYAPIENGPASSGDRHVLVVNADTCVDYEMWHGYPQPNGSWNAGSGAIFNLNSNALRPNGWTSADAAGLSVLAGLVRYDEVYGNGIHHALRFTMNQINLSWIWPARHSDGTSTDLNVAPMGTRLRLKASVDISGYAPPVRTILQALKDYGMILADSDHSPQLGLSGAPDERWNNKMLHALETIHVADFAVVDVSGLMIDPDSGQSR